MVTRTINEVKLYALVLNPMQAPKIEYGEVVAVSLDYDRLVEWYNSQKAPEMWRDGRFGKTFAKGSPLEWYNSANSLEPDDTQPFGHGINTHWVREENLSRIISKYTFIS